MTMAGNKRRIIGDPEQRKGILTTAGLSDKVLDHILANHDLFLGDKKGTAAERMLAVMDSLNALAHDVATEALANRVTLSALPVYGSTIQPDPNLDTSADKHELRYRIIEQYGDKDPVKNDLYTLAEARDIYGADFVKRYWGELGEHCPSVVTTANDRQLWFSVVRYPVDDLAAKERLDSHNTLDSENIVDQITQSPGFSQR